MSTISATLTSNYRRPNSPAFRWLLAAGAVLLATGSVFAGPADTVSEIRPALFGQYGLNTRQRVIGNMVEVELSIAPDSILFNKLPLMVLDDPEKHTPLVAVIVESEIVEGRRIVSLCVDERLRANTIMRFVAQGRNADGTPRPDDLQPNMGRMYHQVRLGEMPAPAADPKSAPPAEPKMAAPEKTPAKP